MGLRQQTFSAIRWTTISAVGKFGLQLIQLMVLARLLIPSDFGLMALVISILSFIQVFLDMGVSSAIIHHQKISHEELSSLYWLNVATGSVLMILLMVASPLIATTFKKPEMQPLLMYVSANFLFNAISLQLRIVSEKDLRFSVLAKLEFFSALIGVIFGVTVALIGGGVYALVFGSLASASSFMVLAWIYLAQGWRPLMRFRLNEIRRFLSFGAYVMGNNLVNGFNRNADVLLGGRILSANALGMYSLPRDFGLRWADMINPIVTRVGFPVMAKSQSDLKMLKTVFLKTIRMTASINFPLYLSLAIFAPEIVMVIFGNQWAASIPLLRVLAIWGLLRSIGNPVGSLLYATGRADLSFKWNLVWLFIIFPVLWVGLQYGSMGLAIALLCLSIIGQIPNWYFLVHPLCGAGFSEYFNEMAGAFISAALAVACALLIIIPLTGNLSRLLVSLGLGSVLYFLVSFRFNREWVNSMVALIANK